MPSNAAPDKPTTDYLFDFVYIDKPRLASYLAQLEDNGVLQTTKQTAQSTESISSQQKSGVPPLYTVNNNDTAGIANALERQFDASWTAIIDTLHLLDERGYVSKNVAAAPLGCAVHTHGQLELLDLRLLKEMWPSIGKTLAQQATGNQKERQAAKTEADFVAGVISKVPHTLQMTLRSEGGVEIWSTLDPAHMTISTDDLAFKHGAAIAGEWHILGVLDAEPDGHMLPIAAPGGNQLREGMLQVLTALRNLLGRPATSYGVTPLAVFRPMKQHN